MERDTASLTYKGSISEAIIEAQKQKKLFVIFISGEDGTSINFENTFWLDERVAAAISRYCIFLHLIEGHVEASQFAAIYPQKSFPSFSAVGYNGLMLWQHEGYINVDSFVDSIEKAWAAIHIQDTTVALLSVALASKESDPPSSRSTDATVTVQGESSTLHNPIPLADVDALNVETGTSNESKALVEQLGNDIRDDNSLQLDTASASLIIMEDNANKENETTEILHSVTHSMASFMDRSNQNNPRSLPLPEATIYSSKPGSSQLDITDACKGTSFAHNEIMENKNAMKSTTVHLSIRMPSGSTLQQKFNTTDRLSSVKSYVDDKQENSLGSYDLAVPYPRKVFDEEDENKTLSELQFISRQALLVVPRRSLPSKHIQPATNQTASNDDQIGYFGHLKWALSYFNPFSYFGGNSGSSRYEQAADDDFWESGLNPGIPSSSSTIRTETSQSNLQNNIGSSSRRSSRPFGSNIHTLRHDEDDFRPSDRNTFWNGNSTQFGGNDK